jgi:hypothetical protein
MSVAKIALGAVVCFELFNERIWNMFFPWWQQRSSSSRKASHRVNRWPRLRLALETLEDRTAPAIFSVNTFADTVEAVRDGSGLDADGNISLRSAIMATNDLGGSNSIVLSAGTYQLTIPRNGNGDDSGGLKIGKGLVENDVTLLGIAADMTVIDANHLDQAMNVGSYSSASISDLTVENGNSAFGAGIGNTGRVELAGVSLVNNDGSQGGGLFNSGNGMAMLEDCLVTGNTAGVGAGILNSGNATAVLEDCQVTNNTAVDGGGVHNIGTMIVTATTIADNHVGDGLTNRGTLRLERSTVSGNTGGGVYNTGTMTVTATTVAGNQAVEGGGIFSSGTMTLVNDTIANNTARWGGGIYTFGFGDVTLINCTIARNDASGSVFSAGGGLYSDGKPVSLKNTIVARNTSVTGPDIEGEVASQGHNLIGNGTGGNGFSDTDFVGTADNPIDPLLGPLQDNGGPTQTMALQAGSLAIDHGDPDGAPATDQRGVARDDHPDIGAFEFQPSP